MQTSAGKEYKIQNIFKGNKAKRASGGYGVPFVSFGKDLLKCELGGWCLFPSPRSCQIELNCWSRHDFSLLKTLSLHFYVFGSGLGVAVKKSSFLQKV